MCLCMFACICVHVLPNLFVFLRICVCALCTCERVFVCHLECTVKVSLWSLGPVSCQTVRDAAPLKGMLSGPFLSIISPATLIKAVAVHPHVPQAATEKSHLSN